MAKLSKKRMSSKGRKRSRPKRSRTMKKAKRGISMKKMMGGSQKPRKVYCVSCRQKVTVSDYELKQNSRGAYQLVGDCGNKKHKVDKRSRVLLIIRQR